MVECGGLRARFMSAIMYVYLFIFEAVVLFVVVQYARHSESIPHPRSTVHRNAGFFSWVGARRLHTCGVPNPTAAAAVAGARTAGTMALLKEVERRICLSLLC